eukprot:snap_masked-scaffold948_size77650-processed-gene-0.6 protein:Tk08297 transcript:snap_masked-scaffold948_size77650-processed-gene-0.6-mRNA-1 annotation:"e3 ubiquitin-protein ligase rnf146"
MSSRLGADIGVQTRRMKREREARPMALASSAESSKPEDSPPSLVAESLDLSNSLVCSVCLDPPVHPVDLPCSHTFCYLCAKGLAQSNTPLCSLCRQPIPRGYLKRPDLVQRTHSDLRGEETADQPWQWFYEGRNGWWKFERRNSEEIEACFQDQQSRSELLICGHLYVIDFQAMMQYRKDTGGRRRQIKRDVVLAQCKGVAGLVVKD